MATAQFFQMGSAPNMIKSDLDMNNYFDFDQSLASSSRADSRTQARAGSSKAHAFHDNEEHQVFAGPSHEYDRFPQQTGVVAGDVRNFAQNTVGFGDFSNTGLDDATLGVWDDTDFNMDMNNTSMFVDPSYIEAEEPQSNVGRLWPGMHQQAALAKAHQQPQQPAQNKGKARAGQVADPHAEESISRLLSQMRQRNNSLSVVAEEDDMGFDVGHMARMKKDEDDMDEDERLLASDEGKKLSSKERRQLRNKVSARAFRSRRKEYIGQLEGEVAAKAQECTTLKTENSALTEENARYRALIQTLLRHPSFTPFIEDISKDPAFIATQTPLNTKQARRSATPSQQVQRPHQQPMLTSSVDLSMLNIGNNSNAFASAVPQNMNSFDFAQPQVFSQSAYTQAQMQQRQRGFQY